MVDLTKILNAVVAGSTAQGGGLGGMLNQLSPNTPGGQGSLADILSQLTGGAQAQAQAQGRQVAPGGTGALTDILKQIAAGGQSGAGAQAGAGGLGGLGGLLGGLLGGGQQAPQAPQAGGMGGLGDLLKQIAGGQQGGGVTQANMPAGGAGGIGDLLGKLAQQAGGQGGLGGLLSQLTQGGAQIQGGLGGLLQQAAESIRNGQMPGGAAGGIAAGGLASILLGTESGRAVAGSVAKLGAMAAIGGVAYLALKNYQQGRPVVEGTVQDVTAFVNGIATPSAKVPTQPLAQQNEQQTAGLLLGAMVGAAMADGKLDANERNAIVGQMEALGLSEDEQAQVNDLLANPPSIADIAGAADSDEMKAQVYIAAHLAVEADTPAEKRYMAQLAQALGFDRTLQAHLDQAAATAKTQGA